MSRRICHVFFIAFFLLHVLCVIGQKGLERRFDLSLQKISFNDALRTIAKTQDNMLLIPLDIPEASNQIINMDLHQVNFGEAMDKLLAAQAIYKDYVVTDHGRFQELELFREKNKSSHYFDREKAQDKYYHVGDVLKPFNYQIENYPGKTIQLPDQQKKLTIIDLWGIYCGACIDDMPKLEKLQDQFNEDIQVLMVTKDSKAQVERLKKYNKIVRETKLPIVTGEEILGSLFDYESVPVSVWVDEKGQVAYITHKPIATQENVRDFLAGQRMPLYETRDTVLDADENLPFATTLQFIHQGDFGVSSYLASHKETRYSYQLYEGGIEDTATVKAIRLQKAGILMLYRYAFGIFNDPSFTNERILLESGKVNDIAALLLSGKSFYDFELITKQKGIGAKQFYRLAQQNLDFFFGLESRMEKKLVPCYILKRIGDIDRLKQYGSEYRNEINDSVAIFSNIALGYVLNELNEKLVDSGPLLNETGLEPMMKVGCHIRIDVKNDLNLVNKILSPYGLTISLQERMLDCIVLKKASP